MSKKVMPASRAASTTGATAPSSMKKPKLLVPRPMTETSSEPIRRVSMPPYYQVAWPGGPGGPAPATVGGPPEPSAGPAPRGSRGILGR